MTTISKPFIAAGLVAAAACAGASRTPGAAPAPAAAATAPASANVVPGGVRWFRTSAEQKAIYLEVYRAAGAALGGLSAGKPAGSWAVIMDADETVIDNSLFEQEIAQAGKAYSEAAWSAWVERAAAPAVAGAVEFTKRVQELGGRVVIVTNRSAQGCDATRRNLQAASIATDLVVCKGADGADDKNPRFEAVAQGRAPSTLPPLSVVMWVGDNIQDFPRATQALRSAAGTDPALARFGVSWFILPNPMYGSWEKNQLPPG
ncbi:MAG: hypothetical protein IT356_08430 [Gemmatimonadaceae bacterium]|nr:hypothetical protein [Gemmatimonadaceae bacterium]